MFHNDNMLPYAQRNKSKLHETKKLKSNRKEPIAKHSRNRKLKHNHKHSKFKHMNVVSDYVGPERLTKHVGFFTKGKISDSISRMEKIMPKEVKARARQDLQEVLKLTSVRSKHQTLNSTSCGSVSSGDQSLRNSYQSPQYLCHKTGFASNSWKDKLQKSVGAASVNSVLASVHKPQKRTPIKELSFIRRVVLTQIHSSIKEANHLLFPTVSNRDKLKRKLQQIKNELIPDTDISFQKAPSSYSISRSSQISPYMDTNNTQSSSKEEFHLNPIFTGDDMHDQSGIAKIFPNAHDFCDHMDKLIPDVESVNLPNEIYHYETISSQAPSSSIGHASTVTLVPTSPTTSNDSPAWKLQLSPVKFVPDLSATPRVYFRHKMF